MRLTSARPANTWLSATCGGSLLALAHPTVDLLQPIVGAVWVIPGIALLYHALHRSATAAAAWRAGWLSGAVYFAATLHWIVYPFLEKAESHLWLLPFAVVLVPAGFGLFWAAAFWAARWLRVSGIAQAVAFTVALSLVEWLRGTIFTGFPWVLLGYAWMDTPIRHGLAWLGAYGLTAVTILVPAVGMAILIRPVELGRTAVPRVAVAVLFIGVTVAVGWMLGSLVDTRTVASGALGPTVRIVQPNIPQREKWGAEYRSRNFDRLLALSQSSVGADLVVWPEAAIPTVLSRTGGRDDFLGRAPPRMTDVLPPATELIAGVLTQSDTGHAYNSLARLDRARDLRAVYDKHHLVPFGEYVPLWGIVEYLGFGAFTQGGFSAGGGPRTIQLDGLPPFVPMICYEAIFPDEVRAAAGAGAQWLLQVTNDAWFGPGAGPRQHLQSTRARAVELGLPLVRVANTGISAMVDAGGRVVDSLPLGEMGGLEGRIPPAAAEPTFYMIHGNLLFWTMLGIGAFGSVLARFAQRR